MRIIQSACKIQPKKYVIRIHQKHLAYSCKRRMSQATEMKETKCMRWKFIGKTRTRESIQRANRLKKVRMSEKKHIHLIMKLSGRKSQDRMRNVSG